MSSTFHAIQSERPSLSLGFAWLHFFVGFWIFFSFGDWQKAHCPVPDKGSELIGDMGISLLWEASIPAALAENILSNSKAECVR